MKVRSIPKSKSGGGRAGESRRTRGELRRRIALNEVNEVKTEGVTEEGDEVPERGAAFSFEQGGREWVFAASSEGEMKEWARKIGGS